MTDLISRLLRIVSAKSAKSGGLLKAKINKKSLEFNIEETSRTSISGWIWQPSAAAERVDLQLFHSEIEIGTVRAEMMRADLAHAGKGDGGHGFSFKFPGHLQLADGDNIVIRSGGDFELHVSIGQSDAIASQDGGQKDVQIEFGVDIFTADEIRGWAVAPSRPDKRLRIDLLDGETILASTYADEYREDLREAGKGDGFHMFAFATPAVLRDGRMHRLTLCCEETGGNFATLEPKIFADIRSDFCDFTPASISGRAWISNGSTQELDIALSINGKPSAVSLTSADGEFDLQLTSGQLWDAISLARKSNTDQLTFVFSVQGRTVRKVSFDFCLSSCENLAVFFRTFDQGALAAILLNRKAGASGITLIADGQPVDKLGSDEIISFERRTGDLGLADGDHLIGFALAEDDTSRIERAVSFHRFEGTLEVVENVIKGEVKCNAEQPDSLAIELLIDGEPSYIRPAQIAEAEGKLGTGRANRVFEFTISVTGRLLDGLPHQAQFRLVGTDVTLPERPILFQAGTPSTQTLHRIESHPGRKIVGWVVAPWNPKLTATVSVFSDKRQLASMTADEPHAMLAGSGVLPVDRGFSFQLSEADGDDLSVLIEIDGQKIATYPLILVDDGRFKCTDSAGTGRDGLCFVIPDPDESALAREEARSLLLLASEAAKVGERLTIAFAVPFETQTLVGTDLVPMLDDLVGSIRRKALAQADFVVLPNSPIALTAIGPSLMAYNLSNWVQANRFRQVIATSRGGVSAYCGDALRQGFLGDTQEIVVLAENFSISDIIDNDQLLDQPNAIFAEALERRAFEGATKVIALSPGIARLAQTTFGADLAQIELVSLDGSDGPAQASGLDEPLDGRWLVFAGPMRTRNGIRILCDALDRVAKSTDPIVAELNLAFVGPEDRVRDKPAVAFIRSRAARWPFDIRIHPNLTWESYRRVMGRFVGTDSHYFRTPLLEGTVWDALCQDASLKPVACQETEWENPPALATKILEIAAGKPASKMSKPAARTAVLDLFAPSTSPSKVDAGPPTGKPPLVSVCISHFNRPTLLRQTIASIQACNYPRTEIIVVDDGSAITGVQDELAQIEEDLAKTGGRVVRQPNKYLGAARNRAAKEAKGDFIIFMDDDNLARPAMIEEFLRVQRLTGAAIVTSQLAMFDALDVVEPADDIPYMIGLPLGPDAASGVLTNCFGDANMLISREAFEAVSGFTEDYGRGHEDWEFYGRANSRGFGHEIICRPLFWYREAATSMLRGRESVEFDLLRNIRGYRDSMPDGAYRILQLAQGLLQRWGKPSLPQTIAARPGIKAANSMAFGRVAVVMRTKNRPILLARAIDSVINQTFSDWALVIVNDGGDPAPVKALVDERRHLLQGRCLVINNPVSTGMENASNAGLTYSTSEFVAIHDDDDAWTPEFLERTVRLLDRAPPVVGGVVTRATVVIERIEDGRVIEVKRYPFKQTEVVELSQLAMENQFPPISFLVRRSVMETVGKFDGELPVLGDWDFHLRVAERFQIDVLPEPLAYYHHRVEGTDTRYGNTVVAQRDIHRILRGKFLNKHVRASLASGSLASGDFLLLGDLGKRFDERMDDFKSHLGWVEKLLNDNREHTKFLESLIEQLPKSGKPR